MKKSTKLLSLAVVVLSLAIGFACLAAPKNNNSGGGSSKKSTKSSAEKERTKVKLKTYQKADKTTGKTNAQVHKEKKQQVMSNLEMIAVQEGMIGNPPIGQELEAIAQEDEQTQPETVAAIEQVEKRGKLKTFLLGTDYKNMGQLRSSLVHNRNQIRKMTQAITQIQTAGGDATALQAQVTTLMQERERIKDVITANETSFSLLGWVVRFLTNYEQAPISETEEEQLADEVAEVVDEIPVSPTDPLDTGTLPDPGVIPEIDEGNIPGGTAPAGAVTP